MQIEYSLLASVESFLDVCKHCHSDARSAHCPILQMRRQWLAEKEVSNVQIVIQVCKIVGQFIFHY